ncbi:choice-of-anchor A family protein [Streptomyces sp. NBC_00237]|uniref:choice-of-anchor A family protein n=1 Tax=Streptomyces sp. NBC_00237 TaxID=2975687 RepID=UPI00224F54CC|nr:choice-of-anchor A family protein [Streptomyces sp. NBC_00237]
MRAAPLPGGLGPCVPGQCPDPFPPINNGAIAGYDNGISVFAGGDFRVRGKAAEAEGRVVVLGAFDMDKSPEGSQIYNVGVAGVGSRVAPPVGSDYLATGGPVTIGAGQRLLAEDGVVRHAGPATGTIVGTSTLDPAAVTPYVGLRKELSDASQCYADGDTGTRPPTGTAVNEGGQTVFTGDNTSALQVFNVDFDLASANGGQQGIEFRNIPDGATILVNVLGTNRTINTYSGSFDDNDPLNKLRGRLLWNFPDATNVEIKGTGQFQGSVLIGNQASESAVSVPGVNGRFFTTGNLTHQSSATGGGGQEFHAYPFNGDLPDCGTAPVEGDLKVLKVDFTTGAPLPGAVFQLWRESNGVAGLQTSGANPDERKGPECTTDTRGECAAKGNEEDSFYWEETRAPSGYGLPDPHVFGPVKPSTPATTTTVRNLRKPSSVDGDLQVLKVDSATGAPLPGAVFQLWRESNGVAGLQTSGANPDERKGAPCTSDEQGVCAGRGNVKDSFYWEETRAPSGYDLPDPHVFGPVKPGTPATTTTVRNKKNVGPEVWGKLTVRKVDSATGAPLPGAVFQLWRESNGVAGLQTSGANPDERKGAPCTTGADGRCTALGKGGDSFYWEETGVPAGYQPPTPSVFGPVRMPDTPPAEGVTIVARNTKKVVPEVKGSLHVLKVDSRTGRGLPRAVVELWRETNGVPGLQTTGRADTRTDSGCATDERGRCDFDGLKLGSYYVRETEAPSGYLLPRNPVSGPHTVNRSNASTGVTVRMTNEEKKVKPKK